MKTVEPKYDYGAATVSSGPATEPLTTTEVKLYLKVDHSTEDDLITSLIVSARNTVQNYTGLKLITQTISEKRDDFPMDSSFALRWSPVTAVSSIAYTDSGGDAQTLSTDVYGVNTADQPARIYRKFGQVWPSVLDQAQSVTITYTAGFANAAAVPAELKLAMYLLIADMYDNRTDYVKTLPTAAEYYMNQHRVKTF